MSLKRLYHAGLFVRLPIPEGHEELSAEIRLHRAVLDQALLDLYSKDEGTKEDVELWLDEENNDFTDACDRADLPPKLVYEAFLLVRKIIVGTNEF